MPEHQQIHQSKKPNTAFQKQATPVIQTPLSNPYSIIQRARINPKSLTHADIMQLQRTIGNQAVGRLLSSIGNTSTAQQATVQRQEIPEEEEPLQGKMAETVQRQEIPEEEEPLQTKRENNTGMPDNLKAGVENLSGIDMSDVRVHYNSSKPAEVGALAYTQGTNIHVAPGQERHLSHEAWHVVQQMQERVRPTMQMKNGVQVNDDEGLEREADVMRAQASPVNAASWKKVNLETLSVGQELVVQRKISGSAFNMVGEFHSKVTQSAEKDYLKKAYGIPPENYWTEFDFLSKETNYAGVKKHADPPIAHVRTQIKGIASFVNYMKSQIELEYSENKFVVPDKVIQGMKSLWDYWKSAYGCFIIYYAPKPLPEDAKQRKSFALEEEEEQRMEKAAQIGDKIHSDIIELESLMAGEGFFLTKARRIKAILALLSKLYPLILNLDAKMGGISEGSTDDKAVMDDRNVAMVYNASQAGQDGMKGVWKVGNQHIKDLMPLEGGFLLRGSNVTLTEEGEFRDEMKKA